VSLLRGDTETGHCRGILSLDVIGEQGVPLLECVVGIQLRGQRHPVGG